MTNHGIYFYVDFKVKNRGGSIFVLIFILQYSALSNTTLKQLRHNYINRIGIFKKTLVVI
jgi:hypothetical protein